MTKKTARITDATSKPATVLLKDITITWEAHDPDQAPRTITGTELAQILDYLSESGVAWKHVTDPGEWYQHLVGLGRLAQRIADDTEGCEEGLRAIGWVTEDLANRLYAHVMGDFLATRAIVTIGAPAKKAAA